MLRDIIRSLTIIAKRCTMRLRKYLEWHWSHQGKYPVWRQTRAITRLRHTYAIGRRLAVSIIVIVLYKKITVKLSVIWLYRSVDDALLTASSSLTMPSDGGAADGSSLRGAACGGHICSTLCWFQQQSYYYPV
jgi:hypothetical protein